MSLHRRRPRSYSEPQSAMTSMIDVVFLLLVFFIITLDPVDLLASMPVQRPAPPKTPTEPMPHSFRLSVMKDGYTANGKKVDLEYVDQYLGEMREKYGMTEALVICYGDAPHSRLIQALDIFMKNDVKQLSLVSR